MSTCKECNGEGKIEQDDDSEEKPTGKQSLLASIKAFFKRLISIVKRMGEPQNRLPASRHPLQKRWQVKRRDAAARESVKRVRHRTDQDSSRAQDT